MRARSRTLWLLLFTLAVAAADVWILPRLYPAFHDGLCAMMLLSSGLIGLELRDKMGRFAAYGLIVGVMCLAFAPAAAKRLHGYGNMRRIMMEHAPLLGRGLRVAAWLSPPPNEEVTEVALVSEVPRSLDWSGHDIVLISIDALRADHLGAYGYARSVSPRIDLISKEGVVFENAYCPTPHTSYSVTSMMTGKYMRPLLALGVGQDSETWAAQLRRYDYKTAGFYPPAVFFIDADRFETFQRSGLDFEYRKEEFADPKLRQQQVSEYLEHQGIEHPQFLWIHFFEPHEPYVKHPEHSFGDSDVDAYDSEIASVDDGVGAIVDLVRTKRPNAIVMITADHGEEFGEHGGRYHGTTVYEEQVRVPLIVVGPGVARNARVKVPVQTIDLLSTTLSALGIPRPARLRGRDLGPILAHPETMAASDEGLAFAETDDFELLASGQDRLICDKRAGACSLYDVTTDRSETNDTSSSKPDRAAALRAELVNIAHAHGKFETQGSDLPEALRIGMQGDVSAAKEVAALLDDANVEIRRKAASVLFALRGKGVVPELSRSLAREEDEEVRRYVALALVRAGELPSLAAEALLHDPNFERRKLAALAFADRGDKRAGADLETWWQHVASGGESLDFTTSKEIVTALGALEVKTAVPDLLTTLAGQGANELRLRPFVADALGTIGDPRAKDGLLGALRNEKQSSSRLHEAQALGVLCASRELALALLPFVLQPEPMLEALNILRNASALTAANGGYFRDDFASQVQVAIKPLSMQPGLASDRVTLLVEQNAPSEIHINGESVQPKSSIGGVSLFEISSSAPTLVISSDHELRSIWAVRAPKGFPLAQDGGIY